MGEKLWVVVEGDATKNLLFLVFREASFLVACSNKYRGGHRAVAGWWGNVVERFMFNIGCNVGFFFDNKEVARRSDIILSPLVRLPLDSIPSFERDPA